MIGERKTKGIGKYQLEKAQKTVMAILRAVSDENPHQYSELKQLTKLNSPTLSKHLERLKKTKVLKRKMDIESGKYPYPVYYSINPNVMPILRIMLMTEQEMHEIEQIVLDPEKTPLDVLDQINTKNNALILSVLKQCKDNKDTSQELVNFVLELTVWHPYRVLTTHLVESSRKTIDNIDIENLQEQNKHTIQVSSVGLRNVGWTEDKIKEFMKKMGRGNLTGQ